MALPTDLHITQILCVASFNRDAEVRHKSALLEKAFKKVIDAQATSTNIPDNFPPELPRLTIVAGKKQLALTQQSVQLTLNFDKDTDSIQERFNIAEKYIRLFWDSYCVLVDEINRKELGIVVVIQEASNKITDKLQEIYVKFSKLPSLGEVASFEFKAGFKTDNVFKNFYIGAYEIRKHKIELAPNPTQQVYIDPSEMPLEETGIEYKFDVNNKPSIINNEKYRTHGAELVLEGLKEFIFEDTKHLLNW